MTEVQAKRPLENVPITHLRMKLRELVQASQHEVVSWIGPESKTRMKLISLWGEVYERYGTQEDLEWLYKRTKELDDGPN